MAEEQDKCERCGGTGKVGEGIFTEGTGPVKSIDIICLECLGTGKKPKSQIKAAKPLFYFLTFRKLFAIKKVARFNLNKSR